MMSKTIAVQGEGFTGIRYREHKTRKYGVKYDRYFYIRYRIGGKLREEGYGWESQGFTASDALAERKKIMQALKTGEKVATLKERRAEADRLRKQTQAAEAAEAKANISFDAFFEGTYQEHRDEKVLVPELPLYKYWIKPVIGEKRFAEIGELDMVKIKKRCLEAGKALRTIEYCYSIVRVIFNTARTQGVYEGAHPITKAVKKSIAYDNAKVRFLTPGEAQQLLTALKVRSKQCHDMAVLSLFCGARAGEVSGLDWCDINMDGKILTLRNTKNMKKTRHIPMPQQVLEMLSEYQQGVGNRPVFVGANGKRVDKISKTYPRTVADLKINKGVTDRRQRVVFHTLRHTYASWLVQKGVHLITVQKLLGHSSIRITERYAHLAPDNFTTAVDILSGLGNSAEEPAEKPAEKKVVNIQG